MQKGDHHRVPPPHSGQPEAVYTQTARVASAGGIYIFITITIKDKEATNLRVGMKHEKGGMKHERD